MLFNLQNVKVKSKAKASKFDSPRIQFTKAQFQALWEAYIDQQEYLEYDTNPLWFMAVVETLPFDEDTIVDTQVRPLTPSEFKDIIQHSFYYHRITSPCIHFAIDKLGYSQSLFTNLI